MGEVLSIWRACPWFSEFANGAAFAAFASAVSEGVGSLRGDPNVDDCGRVMCDGDPKEATYNATAKKNEKYDLSVNKDGVLEGEIDVGCKIYTSTCDNVFKELNQINESKKVNITFKRHSVYKDSDISGLDIVVNFGESEKLNGFFEAGSNKDGWFSSPTPDRIWLDFDRAATSTVLHEFGHAIGISHRYNSSKSLMSYSYERSDNFSSDEVDAILEAY